MAAVVLTALLVATIVALRMLAAGGPSGAVLAGDEFVGAGHPRDLRVHAGTIGYDGQFVYRLALDPFTHRETAYGITLDNPPYRQQRIGLPLTAWAVNRTTRLPVSTSLLLVNALALLAAAWAGAVLARRLGRPALWGTLVALVPGVVIALTRDLTEPLATALLLLGLVAWTGRRTPLALLAFAASTLTRETILAVLFGLGIYEVYVLARGPQRREAAARAAGLLLVVAVYAAWQLHLRDVWGILPLRATQGDIGTPVVHTFQTLLMNGGAWADWHSHDALLLHAWLVERFVLLGLVGLTAYAAIRGSSDKRYVAGWAGGLLLAFSATWSRDVAFLRVANEAILLGTLVLLGSRHRAATAGLVTTAGLSVFVGLLYGAKI